jgi:hypothetical protein
MFVGGLGIVVLAGGCAAMHKQTIENMKANGDPRAPCYEACEASDVMCMKKCDEAHPYAGTILQGGGGGGGATVAGGDAPSTTPPSGVTPEQLQMLTEAAKQDAARRNATSSSMSSSSSSSTSSFTSSQTKSSAPPSPMDCNPPCGGGQKCVVFLQGSKQCAPGGKCWTVDRTHGECK